MTLQTFWIYLGAVVLISATPGPNVLFVTTRSIRFGFGPAMIGMSGCLLALTMILTASVAGVSAFMLAVPTAFEALKYAGAAYLIWLGIQAWREGALLVINEIDNASEDILNYMYQLLDDPKLASIQLPSAPDPMKGLVNVLLSSSNRAPPPP